MRKKILLLLGLSLGIIAVVLVLNPIRDKSPLTSPGLNQQEAALRPGVPSETSQTYTDPSGFSFSYPDNLSLLNNELKDENSYAELQLAANGVAGSLVLKISDSKFKTIDDWIKTIKSPQTPKEVKLGTLNAMEVGTGDKLLLGALDQGILFNIEVPLNEDRDFWMDVYNKILSEFTFVSPTANAVDQQDNVSSPDEVSFEGEEVVQ